MKPLVKCPGARTAKTGACQAAGCNHLSGKRSRICPCCVKRLGVCKYSKFMYLLGRDHYRDIEKFRAFEAECLEWLNANPRAVPLPERKPGGVVYR